MQADRTPPATTMKTHLHEVRRFEFFFPRLDTQILVEELAGHVIIRATRNSFSESRQLAFIRELAAEGFIPDEYRWLPRTQWDAHPGVRWRIDCTWLKLHPAQRTRSRRLMLSLIVGSMVTWFSLMGILLWPQPA